MLIDECATCLSLDRIIGCLTVDRSLRKDLRQEALVHLWRLEQEMPGQTISWYLQGCRLHLQHVLALGKSVDDLKRRSRRMEFVKTVDGSDEDVFEQVSAEDLLEQISAKDMTSLLIGRLAPRRGQVLRKLAEGFTTNEVSQQLGLSHQAVSKHRQRIATLAQQLGIRRPVPVGKPHSDTGR